jgi:hypothetical protein
VDSSLPIMAHIRLRAPRRQEHINESGPIGKWDRDIFETLSCPTNVKPEITKALYNPAVYRRVLFRFYGSVKFKSTSDAE